MAAMKEPAHRAIHPFGQIPTYEEGGLALFESGSIILHIAEQHPGLLPASASARARAISGCSRRSARVEPPILEFATAKIAEGGEAWTAQRLPLVERRVHHRLRELSARPRRCRMARRRVQRRRPDDGPRAAAPEAVGPAPGSTRASSPMSSAPKPGPPTSAPSRRSTRSMRFSLTACPCSARWPCGARCRDTRWARRHWAAR